MEQNIEWNGTPAINGKAYACVNSFDQEPKQM